MKKNWRRQFCEVVKTIHRMISEFPQILQTVPHFTPINRVNELEANKKPVLSEDFTASLPEPLKDKVDAKDPTAMEGNNWSEFENERLQQLERMVRPGANVLMFLDKPVGHYELEEYVFVMRDKIPKYVEMGYKIIAE